MNVVCLVGELDVAPASGFPVLEGWVRVLLRVPRRAPQGGADPGVFSFITVVPPSLADQAARLRGAVVTVVGMLAVDVDYSGERPHAHYVVVAESLQRVLVREPA